MQRDSANVLGVQVTTVVQYRQAVRGEDPTHYYHARCDVLVPIDDFSTDAIVAAGGNRDDCLMTMIAIDSHETHKCETFPILADQVARAMADWDRDHAIVADPATYVQTRPWAMDLPA